MLSDGAALAEVPEVPEVAEEVADELAGLVVCPALFDLLHAPPISAKAASATEKAAVRFVISRISIPLENGRDQPSVYRKGKVGRSATARKERRKLAGAVGSSPERIVLRIDAFVTPITGIAANR
nr:hypothetical protein [Mycobacterium avium]